MRNRLLPEAFRAAKALKLADPSYRVSVRKHYAGAGVMIRYSHWLKQ